KSYRDVHVWKYAIELADKIYDIIALFPKEEIYGLTSQLRWSAVSVASYIAEGCVRNSTKEFIQFIGIAKGSLAELYTQLLIANRRRFVNGNAFSQIESEWDIVSKMLLGLHQTL